jgi:Flp pilus assembly secretin CpaC
MMKTIRALGFGFLLLAATAGAGQDAEVIRIITRQSHIITEAKDIQKIAIGDPDVVDVVIVKKREILLNALAPGRTTVILWFDDGSRKDRVVQVEFDLTLLREQLGRVHKAITVETSTDGKFVLLRGEVPNPDVVQSAIDTTSKYLEAQLPGTKASNKIMNMMTATGRSLTIEDKLYDAIRPYSTDIKISRISQTAIEGSAETFIFDGTAPSQTALTQLLIVIDRLLGGPGSGFKVVLNESGGLNSATQSSPAVQPSAPAGGVTVLAGNQSSSTRASLPTNNLNANVARGLALMGSTGRWVSFIRVRSLPQVQVSVRILDFDRRKVRTVGVNWIQSWANHGPNLGDNQVDQALTILNGLLANTATIVDQRFLLTQTITALETKGYVRTLSEPNLSTLNGETATFLVGGDVPIQTLGATTSTTISGFSFREFGIRLTVRPMIAEDGRTITLDLNPDISDVVPSTTPGGTPSFKRTSISSITRVKDGEALIIGGLIGKKEAPNREQVPILGDIPIIGGLFSRQTDEESERELALILIPKIIYPRPATAHAVDSPRPGFQVRTGAFQDPDLGPMPVVPDFFLKTGGPEEERK